MKYIVLTHPDDIPNEIERIHSLFNDDNLQILHLHKPNYDIEQLENYIKKINAQYHPRIVLHAYPQFLHEAHPLNELSFKLKGIHLPERVRTDRLPLPTNFKVISTSFHELHDVINNEENYEYVFLSPIFNSISKKGYNAAFDMDKLKAALAKSTHSIIALGGMDKGKQEIISKLGFAGMGVLGAVWS